MLYSDEALKIPMNENLVFYSDETWDLYHNQDLANHKPTFLMDEQIYRNSREKSQSIVLPRNTILKCVVCLVNVQLPQGNLCERC